MTWYNMLMKRIIICLCIVLVIGTVPVYSQQIQSTVTPISTPVLQQEEATQEAEIATAEPRLATVSAEEQEEIEQIRRENVTNPEPEEQRDEVFQLLDQRPIESLTLFNVFGFVVQYAISAGVPANTVVLILLLPVLSTLIAFIRHVIGLPSLGLLVSVSLAITLLATGITAGLILLMSTILSSSLSRMILRNIKIMQLPKSALSTFFVSIVIFLVLTFSAGVGILAVKQLSIFPVLVLILLSQQISQLQIDRTFREASMIAAVTIAIGLVGYLILSSQMIRDMVLLYPEIVLLLIPANLAIGRYFGLRLTEYYRFFSITNANK